MTSGARLPTWKERENNKKRERRRRAIASKIFSGLRQFGNYKLPKHCDNNEVLKALCAEAGWVVEEDGTTYRKGAKPVERMEVCASAPASPSPTSSYHGGDRGNGCHTAITPGGMTTTEQQQGTSTTASGASLIPWLKGLSGTTTPTSCFQSPHASAPVTPPLSSPRGSKPIMMNSSTNNNNNNGSGVHPAAAAAAAGNGNGVLAPGYHGKSDWDRIAMAEHWLDQTTGFGNVNGGAGGSWSPVIVGPAIPSPSSAARNAVRPCETPDGCLTPCSDVGDSEPSVTELLSRYSGNKSGRWINGMRVVVNPTNPAAAAAAPASNNNNSNNGILNGFGNMVPTICSSGTATPTAGRMSQFGENGWIKASNTPPIVASSGYNSVVAAQAHHLHQMNIHQHQHQQQQQQQQQQQHHSMFSSLPDREIRNMNKSEEDVQQQCSPCSSSVCGVVVETSGKRKRSFQHDEENHPHHLHHHHHHHQQHQQLDLDMSRLEAIATNDGVLGRTNVSDRLQLTLATPASSS